jgi:glycosyltransferase involved in cell wall biosynthesis
MSEPPLHIWLDAERMKHPYTGLFHFCLELGNALVAVHSEHEDLTFFLPGNLQGSFGKEVHYVHQKIIHKYFSPSWRKMDVWHSMQQDSDYFPRSRVPLVLTIHDLNFLHQPGKSLADKKRALARLKTRVGMARQIVTISSFVLNELQENVSLGDTPATVIYNGCNFSSARPRRPREIPDRPFLFTIGTIAAKKNFHVLPALLQRNDLILVIAGVIQDEAYLERIKNEARRLRVADRIIFAGAVPEEEKQWYYKNCMAFVFPSLAEGFGMPVLEAMYFGKPVFLSTKTSLPEIGGELAYYFQNFEPEHMVQVLEEGLQHYLDNSSEVKLQAHAASFSWITAARRYLELYHRVAR